MIMKWNELSMKDKAAVMKVAINNGVTDLNDIKNKFEDGGYFDYMDKLAKKKAKDWGENEDEVLIRMLNDNTYNYKAFYDNDREAALKMLTEDPEAHFSDVGKTVYHPTFSNESIYSGKVSDYNPRGTIGGRWVNGNEYRPSYSQVLNKDFDFIETEKYLRENNNGEYIDWYYFDIYDKAKEKENEPAVLNTFYPIISMYPRTGHSSLAVSGLVPNYYGDAQVGTISINKGARNKDYNLVTNNCSDATRCALEKAFDKEIDPFLFTTPGDVQDFALTELGGKKYIVGDSIYIPGENKYEQRSKEDINKAKIRGLSTVYIPMNKDQKNKLIEYIHKGKINREFKDGGPKETLGIVKDGIPKTAAGYDVLNYLFGEE